MRATTAPRPRGFSVGAPPDSALAPRPAAKAATVRARVVATSSSTAAARARSSARCERDEVRRDGRRGDRGPRRERRRGRRGRRQRERRRGARRRRAARDPGDARSGCRGGGRGDRWHGRRKRDRRSTRPRPTTGRHRRECDGRRAAAAAHRQGAWPRAPPRRRGPAVDGGSAFACSDDALRERAARGTARARRRARAGSGGSRRAGAVRGPPDERRTRANTREDRRSERDLPPPPPSHANTPAARRAGTAVAENRRRRHRWLSCSKAEESASHRRAGPALARRITVPHSACRLAHPPRPVPRGRSAGMSEVRAALGRAFSRRQAARIARRRRGAPADAATRVTAAASAPPRQRGQAAERLDELDDWLVGDGARASAGALPSARRIRRAAPAAPARPEELSSPGSVVASTGGRTVPPSVL